MPVSIDDFVVCHGSLLFSGTLYSPGAFAPASAKVAQTFVLHPVLEHIAETLPSSSEFIAGNRNRADANPSCRSIAASFPPEILFHADKHLDHLARDRQVEHPLGHHVRRRLDALACRNLGNFVLCVNLTTNSGELNSRKETGVAPQFFSSALMR